MTHCTCKHERHYLLLLEDTGPYRSSIYISLRIVIKKRKNNFYNWSSFFFVKKKRNILYAVWHTNWRFSFYSTLSTNRLKRKLIARTCTYIYGRRSNGDGMFCWRRLQHLYLRCFILPLPAKSSEQSSGKQRSSNFTRFLITVVSVTTSTEHKRLHYLQYSHRFYLEVTLVFLLIPVRSPRGRLLINDL